MKRRDRSDTVKLITCAIGDKVRLTPAGKIWVLLEHKGHQSVLERPTVQKTTDNNRQVYKVNDMEDRDITTDHANSQYADEQGIEMVGLYKSKPFHMSEEDLQRLKKINEQLLFPGGEYLAYQMKLVEVDPKKPFRIVDPIVEGLWLWKSACMTDEEIPRAGILCMKEDNWIETKWFPNEQLVQVMYEKLLQPEIPWDKVKMPVEGNVYPDEVIETPKVYIPEVHGPALKKSMEQYMTSVDPIKQEGGNLADIKIVRKNSDNSIENLQRLEKPELINEMVKLADEYMKKNPQAIEHGAVDWEKSCIAEMKNYMKATRVIKEIEDVIGIVGYYTPEVALTRIKSLIQQWKDETEPGK